MPTSLPLPLALVEDDAELRQLYVSYLGAQPELQCVLVAASAEEFFEQLPDLLRPPQVVVLDVGLPGRSGLDALPLLKQQLPRAEVVMHTVFDDADRVYQALCRGATGYVLKSRALAELKAAILEVASGGAPMSRAVARQVLAHFKPQPTTQAGLLSEREQQVLEAIIDGLSDKQVAVRLAIAPETVRSHNKSIYRKLHVSSRTELLSRHAKGRL